MLRLPAMTKVAGSLLDCTHIESGTVLVSPWTESFYMYCHYYYFSHNSAMNVFKCMLLVQHDFLELLFLSLFRMLDGTRIFLELC